MANFVTKSIFSFSVICLMALALCLSTDTSMAASPDYCVLPNKDVTPQIVRIARYMLGNPMGTCLKFTLNDKNYEGCVEWHWDQVKGKHKGVTVYIECKSK
jgi:hypothetical protein